MVRGYADTLPLHTPHQVQCTYTVDGEIIALCTLEVFRVM